MTTPAIGEGTTGRIVTFTVINVATPEFAEQAPYGLAIVEFDSGERALVRIADGTAESMSIAAGVSYDHSDDHGPVFRLK
jgi:uncharacterized OB-fold protein